MKNTVYEQNGFKILEHNGFYYVKELSWSIYVIKFYRFISDGAEKKKFDNFSQAYNYVKSLQT